MNKRSWLGIMTGVAFGSLAVAGWRLYGRRSTERIPSQEGIDDPAAARAYGRIMRLPHMALLRRFVARRATESGRRGRGGRSRLRPRLSGHRAGAPCARTPRDGRGFVRRHADPGDRQRRGWPAWRIRPTSAPPTPPRCPFPMLPWTWW